MQYRIYLDSLFIQEVILNFYVLMLCRICLISSATRKRLILASVFAGGYQVFLFLLPLPTQPVLFYTALLGLYMVGSFVTMRIAFGNTKHLVYIKRISIYMVFMLIVGGIFLGILPKFAFYNRSKVKFIFFLIVGAMVYVTLWKIFREKRQNQYYGQIQVIHGKEVLEGVDFMDSGNALVESISQKPVLLADSKWLFEKFEKEELLTRPGVYKSVGKQKGILYAYCIDKIIIYDAKEAYTYEKVWIGICREDIFTGKNYQMIVPPFYGAHKE